MLCILLAATAAEGFSSWGQYCASPRFFNDVCDRTVSQGWSETILVEKAGSLKAL